ncbi:3'-5' exonuclease [Streptomyces europaeiscabiei]|uniref:3'-5' exonuclease n=1 Tax=Streptomyces europaeiscabiei TaxID=146819 RepID=UPI002E272938|nr:3'-5' exonuclease [Streptomyces europaeiscabiei]
MTASPSTESAPAALPVYKRGELPEDLAHLRTVTELKADRLKPAVGQEPVALLRVYRRGHGWGEFPLYDPAGAAKMRPLSAKQQRTKDARRTCPRCETVRGYVVHRVCQECRDEEHRQSLDLHRRTCVWCRRVSVAQHPTSENSAGRRGECVPCWLRRVIRNQLEQEQLVVWRRTCPGRDCAEQTSTDEEIAAARADGTWWGPRWCPPCKERDEREHIDRHQRRIQAEKDAREARRQEVRGLIAWARDVLADPDTVVLDTETTGLEDDARIVDLAVTTVAGEVLMDTLVNPGGEPIPTEATDIHGITDEDVASAPTFASVLEQLGTVLRGRRCLIYNKPYDVGRLRHELTVHHRQAGHPDPEAAATAWLDGMRFEDAMIPYSNWYGDWSDYWGNYAWQPLYGGDHRAVSDCRAVVERLREMAAAEDR